MDFSLNRVSSLLLELLHRIEDNSLLNADISNYISRVEMEMSNLRQESIIIQPLRAVQETLRDLDQNNPVTQPVLPLRAHTGIKICTQDHA